MVLKRNRKYALKENKRHALLRRRLILFLLDRTKGADRLTDWLLCVAVGRLVWSVCCWLLSVLHIQTSRVI